MTVQSHFPMDRRGRNESGGALSMSAMNSVIPVPTWFRRMRAGALAAARRIRSTRLGRLRWERAVLYPAETGDRQVYGDRSTSYSDFNRVTKSLRQPGSAMKPIVYLAAFRQGIFDLESRVPDEPICVPDGGKQSTKWISNHDGQFKGLIPLREALAESRNAVAVWITEQIGIASILRTSQILGVQTTLQPYATTSLGASEVNLLELANAYRTMASGILARPYVIRKIVRDSGPVAVGNENGRSPVSIDDSALSLIQEGLRGVVRLPAGTAHALDSRGFPIAVMGKTGTTNEFRDALFVGST